MSASAAGAEARRQQAYPVSWARLARFTGSRPLAHVCPISADLMVDPVIASDGRSHERAQIQRAPDRGLRRSPLDNTPLRRALTPNKVLATSIREYGVALDQAPHRAGACRRRRRW